MEEENIIEKLNLENIELQNSKEYRLGKKILIIKEQGFIKFIKSIILSFKMRKYNHKASIKNEFSFVNNLDLNSKKIVIYSALISDYDSIKEPFFINKNCDYILFTDQNINNSIWKKREIPENIKKLKNPILINRYIKMHPFELFSDYDYAIYIDSSIQIVSNLVPFINRMDLEYGLAFHKHRYRDCLYEEIKCCHLLKKGNKQKLENQKILYEKEGFPIHYGLLECGVFVVDLHNKKSQIILENWWVNFSRSESLRDQIAFPYTLWKMNIKLDKFGGLGNNLYKNSKIRVYNEHKKNN